MFRLETKDTVFWVRVALQGTVLMDELRDVSDG